MSYAWFLVLLTLRWYVLINIDALLLTKVRHSFLFSQFFLNILFTFQDPTQEATFHLVNMEQ